MGEYEVMVGGGVGFAKPTTNALEKHLLRTSQQKQKELDTNPAFWRLTGQLSRGTC